MMRCREPGWELVGMPAELLFPGTARRGLWIRYTPPYPEELRQRWQPLALELCSGRDGDDAYVAFQVGERLAAEQLRRLEDVISTLWYAFDITASDASCSTDVAWAARELVLRSARLLREWSWRAADTLRRLRKRNG